MCYRYFVLSLDSNRTSSAEEEMDPVTQKPLKYSLDSTPAPSHTWPTQEDPAPGRKERSDRPCAEGDYESLVARVSMRRVFCELFLNLINSVWLEMFPINRHH